MVKPATVRQTVRMPVRVAVVDDDADFRRVAVQLLCRRGYDVVGQAGSVEEARRVFEDQRPDAVLIDQHLPDGTGADLMLTLQRERSTMRTLLTSSDPEAIADPALASRFVLKERLASINLELYLGVTGTSGEG